VDPSGTVIQTDFGLDATIDVVSEPGAILLVGAGLIAIARLTNKRTIRLRLFRRE